MWWSGTEWAVGRLPLQDRSSPSSVLCRCWSLKLLQVNNIIHQTERKEWEIKKKKYLNTKINLKGADILFWGKKYSSEEKQSKQTLLWMQTDLKGRHDFILLYFVYMWRTLPPFQLQTMDLTFLWEQIVHSVIKILFSRWRTCLFLLLLQV